jgi:hypothetical protein
MQIKELMAYKCRTAQLQEIVYWVLNQRQDHHADVNQVQDREYSDVPGPMQTVIPGNKRCILCMTYGYSRYTKIYCLEAKSDKDKKYAKHTQNSEEC